MSSLSQPPQNYTTYNSIQTKQLAIVVDIDGGADYLTSTKIGRQVRYGDPIVYGQPDLVYGGLIPVGSAPGERGQRNIIDQQSQLTISQTLEPEQGRASISTLSMQFIDKDQYMTKLMAPGVIVDELLGKQVKVWLGYAQTSFPEDYYVVWRGRVAQINSQIGTCQLQFTDPSLGNLAQVFYPAETELALDIDAVQTTIPLVANGDFHKKILGPDGTYDQTIKTYLVINDEIMEYQQTGHESDGFGSNQFINVIRGARGTIPAVAAQADTVDASIEISGHMIDLALKLQLSGWNGPYVEDVPVDGFVVTGDPSNPTVPNGIVLPLNVDAVRDLGITAGDHIIVTGSAGSDGAYVVEGFDDITTTTNRIILLTTNIPAESGTAGTISIRSQYDVYPIDCGSMLPGWEIDVAGFIEYKNTYLFDDANSYRFYLTDQEECKSFIESEIMLPTGAYTLTRQGKLSMGLTKPPIADERTITLNKDNVLNPDSITVQRGVNNRKYFNEIDWDYDFDDAGDAGSLRRTLDTDSLNSVGVSYVLPIVARGVRTDLDFGTIVEDRERFLLQRYAKGAVLIQIQTNFGTGNQIEVGDVVLLKDNGDLQIPNMVTGVRDVGSQLYEVINRSLDMKSGITQLTLQGGIGALASDRYATIAPSSLLTSASSSSRIVITESFGEIFPGQEYRKWQDYVGLRVTVSSPDYTHFEETTFIGFDPSNPHALILSPGLSFTPLADYCLDLADYSTSTQSFDQATAKLIHAFLDPAVTVTSGVSNTSFNIGSADVSKFQVGMNLLVHDSLYTILSPEAKITSIAGTLVTVDTDLTFTPAAGQFVELLGFADFNVSSGSGAPYRFV